MCFFLFFLLFFLFFSSAFGAKRGLGVGGNKASKDRDGEREARDRETEIKSQCTVVSVGSVAVSATVL